MTCKPHPIDTAAALAGGRGALAKKLNVTSAAIGNWKVRGVPVQKCVEIERLSCGSVNRKDLRPGDWADIWPELAALADAPPPHIPV